MKTRNNNNWKLLGAILIVLSLIGSGCASKKNLWGDPETGLILKYKAPEDGKLSYVKSSDFVQRLEIKGQKISIDAVQDFNYSMTPEKSDEQSTRYLISIDSVDYSISSPTGDIYPDMSSIIGESFGMDITSTGYEKNFEEAKSIKYSVQDQEQSVASSFYALFPQLPDQPVKVGDTWKSVDTIVEENARGDLLLVFNNLNTIVSIEKFNGLDCGKVDTKVSGTMNGGGKEKDVVYDYDGDLAGSGTWYFAYKEGVLVQETGTGTGKGNIMIPSKDMIIPMERDIKVAHRLLR